jgi:xanthine dehydrogenase accessory factor
MFDLSGLKAALASQGRVVRVVIAGFEGSSPREVGAAMLVWETGQSGTIGGGALEFQAAEAARGMLRQPPSPIPSPPGGGEAPGSATGGARDGRALPSPLVGEGEGGGAVRVDRVPLGPSLGQCCGGVVTLVSERFDAVPVAEAGVFARAVDGRAMPLAVKRMISRSRGEGVLPAPVLMQGWLVEPVAVPARQIWVWGAGHVGRALVAVLAPLPGVAVTWMDTGAERFPKVVPEGVVPVWAADVAGLVAHAPKGAEHLIVTYSHALDLELCHRLLGRGFGFCGLIGSATKWARFRSRLVALGHMPGAIERITCPIGDVSLGKHPQAIAVGVAVQILTNKCKSETEITDDNHGDRRGRKA